MNNAEIFYSLPYRQVYHRNGCLGNAGAGYPQGNTLSCDLANTHRLPYNGAVHLVL